MSYNDPVEQRLARLNEFTLGLLKEALEADYGADLTPVLRTALGTYTIKRSDILDRSDTDSTYTVSEVNYAVSEYETPTIAGFETDAHSIYSAASSIPSTIVEIRPFFSHITGPITLRSFPHPDVFAQVTGSPQNTYMQDPAAAFTYLPQILDRGRVLWSTHARSIVQLSATIAVKAGPAGAVDPTEHALLATLAARAPGVPAPRPMGIVQIGGVVFMFMSCVPGTPLDKCWGELSKAQKVAVRRQLNQALHQLRSVPYTPGTPLGALAAPFACKDTRPAAALAPYAPAPAYVHTSARAIYTETGFNDFLLATPRARVAPAYARWVRSLLRDTHRMVLTHGDLRPHNILVAREGTRATLAGIVDWERGGWYPEYWELLKALRTRTPEDESDWWEWMPEVIAGYRAEVAIDRVVEATIAPPGQVGGAQGQGSQGAG
ncbi:kinase-like protein [Dentipellis sp. KUC8613]|nr:kinase-like protein [Dentipellis sp. KUC8613]